MAKPKKTKDPKAEAPPVTKPKAEPKKKPSPAPKPAAAKQPTIQHKYPPPRGDMAAVIAVFNPAGSIAWQRNLALVRESVLKAGVRLFISECVFPGQAPTIQPIFPEETTVARADSILWQAQAQQNALVASLPEQYDKIVVLDADVILRSETWPEDVAEALNRFVVVQPFGSAQYLDQGETDASPATIEKWAPAPSFGSCWINGKGDNRFAGHTGFAWAFRRNFFKECGVYELALTGACDTFLAHSLVGNLNWYHKTMCASTPEQWDHLEAWAKRVLLYAQGSVGYVSGRALHLWHGPLVRRDYGRHEQLNKLGFNPYTDLKKNADGLWEWNSDKPQLHAWAQNYFTRRNDE